MSLSPYTYNTCCKRLERVVATSKNTAKTAFWRVISSPKTANLSDYFKYLSFRCIHRKCEIGLKICHNFRVFAKNFCKEKNSEIISSKHYWEPTDTSTICMKIIQINYIHISDILNTCIYKTYQLYTYISHTSTICIYIRHIKYVHI